MERISRDTKDPSRGKAPCPFTLFTHARVNYKERPLNGEFLGAPRRKRARAVNLCRASRRDLSPLPRREILRYWRLPSSFELM